VQEKIEEEARKTRKPQKKLRNTQEKLENTLEELSTHPEKQKETEMPGEPTKTLSRNSQARDQGKVQVLQLKREFMVDTELKRLRIRQRKPKELEEALKMPGKLQTIGKDHTGTKRRTVRISELEIVEQSEKEENKSKQIN